jgi:DNA-binding transcriptional regulator/RsmH inhibitor MraZ
MWSACLIAGTSIIVKFTAMKRNKIAGSGRKVGSQNVIQREVRECLRLHLLNELDAIQERINELTIAERYKVAAMLFRLIVAPANESNDTPPPVIVIPQNL